MKTKLILLLVFLNYLEHSQANNANSAPQPLSLPQNSQIQNLLTGSWVNEKVLYSLNNINDFKDCENWVHPMRSFSFYLKKGRLALVIETEFERQHEVFRLDLKDITDSSCKILLTEYKGYKADTWTLKRSDSSILLTDGKTRYQKFNEKIFYRFEPLPTIYNTMLLEGRYRVYDGKHNRLANYVTIKKTEHSNQLRVDNFPLIKNICACGDLESPLIDKSGKKYFRVSYNCIDSSTNRSCQSLAYEKRNGLIYLYSFKETDPNNNRQLIDHLETVFILVKE